MRRVFVVLALTLSATAGAQTVSAKPRWLHGFVRAQEAGALDAKTTAELWDSFSSAENCQSTLYKVQLLAEISEFTPAQQQQFLKEHPMSADQTVCQEGLIAKLTIGTAVDAKADAAAVCGDTMARVVVRSGKHQGKAGCIEVDSITDKRPKTQ